ncbi:hypothetical protein [Sphingomonas oligoaromativorans]|uniref:hypothetical protein n=1 Tax=Sphingomonas oligoaromativorans TaxID=575322 RepID=UPI001421B2CA|nr:hypothetical protein [Sphingomonas oligoaromativorans]NIJ34318.1 hypothetical protein [Sphingomonas oligoaromativorans]
MLSSVYVLQDRLLACPPTRLPSEIRHDTTRPRCGMSYIARRAGWGDLQVPTLVRKIRALIRGHGFPPPASLRQYRGEFLTGAKAVGAAACWDKGMVDRWFDDRTAPEIILAAQNDEKADAAELLDQRAALLGRRR